MMIGRAGSAHFCGDIFMRNSNSNQVKRIEGLESGSSRKNERSGDSGRMSGCLQIPSFEASLSRQ